MMHSKMADKFTLRSAVAFAEGMKRVQLSEMMRRAAAESSGVRFWKMFFSRKLLEDRAAAL